MKYLSFFILFFTCLGMGIIDRSALANSPELNRPRQVDFRIYYPIISFSSSSFDAEQKNYLGLGLSYEVYFFEQIGLMFNPTAFFIPIRIRNNSIGVKTSNSTIFVSAGVRSGPIFRPFARSFLDPKFAVYVGGAITDTFGQTSPSLAFVAGTRAYLNIYSVGDRFADQALALNLSGSAERYFNELVIMKPNYFDIGLSLRGSF